jgi:hypothetical protein
MSASTCTDTQLVPRVAELSVSQGAPGYTRLARGKETIVRAYLATPNACTVSSRQSIAPVSATLDVSYSNGASGTAAQLTNYQPVSGKLGATAQIYATSDPFFVVPASYLAPTSTMTKFDVTFTLKITYSRNGSATYLTTTGNETNAKKTATIDQKTNALRVLVVPMGDPTSTSTQWSGAAETALQNVLTNAARALPVPTGISPELSATATGGIRYVVSTTLLDARSLGLYKTSGSATKFCAGGANWSTSQVTSGAYIGHTLKADLLQRLADYNRQNTPPADLVLGVIDGAIAWKSTDGLGCDDGRAATPASKAVGQIAWVRVSTDSYPTPLQMELMHPFGVSDANFTFHSTNVEADGAGPDHGYNVLQRKVVSTVTGALGTNDHSIMNYNTTSIPYTKDNTLLEPNDWMDALCDLGGSDSATATPFQNCTLNGALGTSQGVPAGRNFYQISGILAGAAVRVTFAKANVPGDVEMGTGAASSPLHLLLCSGTCSNPSNVRKDVGVALLPDEGHADGGTVDLNGGDGFDALVEMDSGWTDAALTLNNVTVFTASAADAAPDVVSTSSVTPGTVVRSFQMPETACCNGRAIAFDGADLYTTLSSGSTVYKLTTSGSLISTFGVGTTLGALAYNGETGHLYGGDYTGNGNVYDIDPNSVDVDTGQAAKTTLFSFNDPGSCFFGGDAIDGLEYRPAAGNLALSGDACDTVYIKKLDGTAVSQFGTDNNSGITTDGAGGLWLALLTEGDVEYTQLTHVDAAGNVLGPDLILDDYEAEDLAYDSVTFAPTCVVWTNQATFGEEPPEIRAVAVPCAGAAGGQSVAVQTTNTRFVSLFFTCGNPNNLADEKFTLANGLVPGSEGEVLAPYTDQLFCGEGTPKIISEASNGWTSTGPDDAQAVEPVTATSQSPTTNVASPLNGGKYRRGEFVHYEGSATDAEQSAITGGGLKWYDSKPSTHQIGTGQSFDLKLAADAPLGEHVITLTATDAQGHTASTTVTITVGPALCPSTSKCP